MSDATIHRHTLGELVSDVSVEIAPRSEVEIRGAITLSAIGAHRGEVLRRLGKEMTIPGFRRGHIPADVIAKRIGEIEVLKAVAEEIIGKAHEALILTYAPKAIGEPSVRLLQVVVGSPVTFAIRYATLPSFTLPDYTRIAKEHQERNTDDVSVSDAEVIEVIDAVREREAHARFYREHPEISHEHHDPIPKESWPTLTDEMVQALGDFKNVGDFRDKMRANIGEEKRRRARDKRRAALGDALISATTVEVPEPLITHELSYMISELSFMLAQRHITLEQYLAHTKKTVEDIQSDMRGDATKRATLNLLLSAIAEAEGIAPRHDDIEAQVVQILSDNPHANETSVRAYLTRTATNRMVFEFLEGGTLANAPTTSS